MRRFLAYFIPIVLAFAIGALGSYIQGVALEEWYPYLVKSPATPPPLVFPIAWGVLYLLMSVSIGTLLEKGDLSVVRLWLFLVVVRAAFLESSVHGSRQSALFVGAPFLELVFRALQDGMSIARALVDRYVEHF